MKKIECFKTFDGIVHDTYPKANRHIDKIYGDKLCKIAHKLLQMKYVEMTNFIDQNLNMFVELKMLKDDMDIEKDENNY